MITHEKEAVHVQGDAVKTIILALCCLEYFWNDHPDVLKELAKAKGDPGLVRYAQAAKSLRLAITKKDQARSNA
jgi:hypothetical protein